MSRAAILANIFLVLSVAACSAAMVHQVPAEMAKRDRMEVERCEEGYTKACQQVAAMHESINTLGGQQ